MGCQTSKGAEPQLNAAELTDDMKDRIELRDAVVNLVFAKRLPAGMPEGLDAVESAFVYTLDAFLVQACVDRGHPTARALRNELFALMGLRPPRVVWGRDHVEIAPALIRFSQGYRP